MGSGEGARSEADALSWLGRKVGWGFVPGQWREWSTLGVDSVIDLLVSPASRGIAARPDPFADIVVAAPQARVVRQGVASWIDHAVISPRPLETFMEFFWSDYFGVSIRSIRPQYVMFDYMNLLAQESLGNFAALLRGVTINAAMLGFLDGATNVASSPNENFSRELLELYSMGVGHFDEADVVAGARALTGWIVENDTEVRFDATRHDDEPQRFLGVEGVHDVDTVIAAVLANPATATTVVTKLADAILGVGHQRPKLAKITKEFAATWELRPVIRSLLEFACAGAAVPAMMHPIAWYVAVLRATPARPSFTRTNEFFQTVGQIPLTPPNVGGYPPSSAYVSTSATIARFNFASHLAGRSGRFDDVLVATKDLTGLALRFGLAQGFSQNTYVAISRLEPGIDRLAAALASPDLAVV